MPLKQPAPLPDSALEVGSMGGETDKRTALAQETWLGCRDRAIWFSATHIPGIENEADFFAQDFLLIIMFSGN